jgi:uncharacterized protein (TIGR03067 family)
MRYWRSMGVLCLLGATVVLAPVVTQGDDLGDRRALEGRWEGHVADPRGDRPGPIRFQQVLITPERIRATRGDGSDMGEGNYRLGEIQGVRTMDAYGLAGETRGKTYLGIYQLRGDTLWWCTANPGKPRPQEFASRPGAGQFLMVLRRAR